MGYVMSKTDTDNIKWFKNDGEVNSLIELTVEKGCIRGIHPCDIEFKYPITVFAGENGSGKSTILALATCAYHNQSLFKPFGRTADYYTFKDFFKFLANESGLQGVQITYKVRTKEGDMTNILKRRKEGRWTNYDTRRDRNVVYLGVNRLLPPSESTKYKNCKKYNYSEKDKEILTEIAEICSKIFCKSYDKVICGSNKSRRLFTVYENKIQYTGFNMGAGENVVISTLLDLLNAGKGALLVIDEIELGLHANAQLEFIEVLKEICKKNKCQIICSTHSGIIINALPPEARIYIEKKEDATLLIPEISTKYAVGKMSNKNSNELEIFVEDEVASAILTEFLPEKIRNRIKIYEIGSYVAVLRQMAAEYRLERYNFIAFIDGDQRKDKNAHIKEISSLLEDRVGDVNDFKSLMESKLHYIPGDQWPEKNLLSKLLGKDRLDKLSYTWGTDDSNVKKVLKAAIVAGKHKEFYTIGQRLALPLGLVRLDCIRQYKILFPDECNEIESVVKEALSNKIR